MLDLIAAVSFPPPVHGQSTVNLAVIQRAETDVEVRVTRANIAPNPGSGPLIYHVSRMTRVLKAAFTLLSKRKSAPHPTIYLVCESGPGIIYNIFLSGICRLLAYPVVMHHHTSAHTKKYRAAFGWTARVLGPSAIHVALSEKMAADLARQYALQGQVVVSHNAIHVPDRGMLHNARTTPPLHIGVLSNLTKEKGAQVVARLAKRLNDANSSACLVVAGPLDDALARQEIAAAAQAFPQNLRYVGPLYGRDKTAFLESLSIFLFPSTYRFECQPLVVLEAMSFGLPIIAVDMGYTGELVGDAGQVIAATPSMDDDIFDALMLFVGNPADLPEHGRRARARFEILRSQARDQFDRLSFILKYPENNPDRPPAPLESGPAHPSLNT